MRAVFLTTTALLVLCLVLGAQSQGQTQGQPEPKGNNQKTPNNPYGPPPTKNPFGADGKFDKNIAANNLANKFANQLSLQVFILRDFVLDTLNGMSQTCGCMKEALAPFVPPYGKAPPPNAQGAGARGSQAAQTVNSAPPPRG